MITMLPAIYDQRLKNSNERVFLALLWILSNYNQQPAFFSKEYINFIGSEKIFTGIVKKLADLKIISYQVKGAGILKHRYFTIIDPVIIEELKKIKLLPKEKPSKPQTKKKTDNNSISFEFNSVLSVMRELKKEFSDYCFTDSELQENANSFIEKSQSYKFYKGDVTRNKIKIWMRNSIKHTQENGQKNKSTDSTPFAPLGSLQNNEAVQNFEKMIQDRRAKNQKKTDPIDADFEIIDEQTKNKNAPA